MKAIIIDNVVARLVPDDTPSRPGVSRTVVDSEKPEFDAHTHALVENWEITATEARRSYSVVPLPEHVPDFIDALAFNDRLTDAEWAALEEFASQVPAVKASLRRLDRAQQVDLLDPALPVLFGAAVQAGVLAAERPAEILAR